MNHLKSTLVSMSTFDSLVADTNKIHQDLIEKKRKQCTKCGAIKPIKEFEDVNLKTGVGKVCLTCKFKASH